MLYPLFVILIVGVVGALFVTQPFLQTLAVAVGVPLLVLCGLVYLVVRVARAAWRG